MKNPEEYIKNIELINPFSITLKSDGGGEFPDSYEFTDDGKKMLTAVIKQAQVDAYNEALDDVAENAEVKCYYKRTISTTTSPPDIRSADIDRQSILKLKK